MAAACKGRLRSKTQASERRKTQNRAAQKKYREKQKTRLQELERLAEVRLKDGDNLVNADPIGDVSSGFIPDVEGLFPESNDLAGPDVNNVFSMPTPSTANDMSMLGLSRVNIQTDSSQTVASTFADDLSFVPLNVTTPDTECTDFASWNNGDVVQMAPESSEPNAPNPRVVDLADPQMEVGSEMRTNETSERSNDAAESTISSVPKSPGVSDRSWIPIFGDCQTSYTPFAQGLCESDRELQLHNALGQPQDHSMDPKKRNVVPDIIRRLRLDDVEDNECAIRNVINMNYSMRDVFLAGLKYLGGRHIYNKEKEAPSFVRRSAAGILPDSKRNTLQLVKVSSTRAMLANATALEYDLQELYRDNAKSKFHAVGDIEGSATRTDPWIRRQSVQHYPQDLIPVVQQFDNAHPPWLDLIPFPTFRARAISAILAAPPLIDHRELKTDVVINEGLRCWYGEEIENAHDSANSVTAGIGQPWDRRSWDAAPWFLRKYWMLLGGEESELWENTSWWRGFRGEKSVSNRWDETVL